MSDAEDDELLISCVIVNYNSGPLLVKAVKSVLGLVAGVNVIVVDNDSEDDSISRLKKEISPSSYLEIIKNNSNKGFSGGVNTGLQSLRSLSSDWILVMNPDAVASPMVLQQLLGLAPYYPDAGMFGCLILNEDGSEQRGCRRLEPTPVRSLATLIGLNRWLGKGVNLYKDALPEEPIKVDAISGAFMLIRREAIEKVGPMDEGYFLHCEDLDWCRRFRDAGYDILFVPQVSITHVKGVSSVSRPFFVEWYKHKGMSRYYHKFFAKNYVWPIRLLIDLSVWLHFVAILPVLAARKFSR